MHVEFSPGKGVEVEIDPTDPEPFVHRLVGEGRFKGATAVVIGIRRADKTVSCLYAGNEMEGLGLSTLLGYAMAEDFWKSPEGES